MGGSAELPVVGVAALGEGGVEVLRGVVVPWAVPLAEVTVEPSFSDF